MYISSSHNLRRHYYTVRTRLRSVLRGGAVNGTENAGGSRSGGSGSGDGRVRRGGVVRVARRVSRDHSHATTYINQRPAV